MPIRISNENCLVEVENKIGLQNGSVKFYPNQLNILKSPTIIDMILFFTKYFI